MKILITGAKGFIGRNLSAGLRNRGYEELLEYDVDSSERDLERYTAECDVVVHLAGVNRPENVGEFMEGNFGFTSRMLSMLESSGNKAPLIVTSSIQAELDNPYGVSKKAGEEAIFDYGERNGVRVFVYRLPNVFGKWCRPNYNSVVATFCHNIARNMPIRVNDPSVVLNLVYVDDVVRSLIASIESSKSESAVNWSRNFESVVPVHTASLGVLAALIESFRRSRANLSVPKLDDQLQKKLYSTYLSYLAGDDFSYPLKMNVDDRGSFTEFLKSDDRGQVSINISKPGIVKGNHWHNTKNEKFLVVSGKGIIRFRRIDSDEVIEYHVSGDRLEVVDIPVGYTHNIENMGDTDMVTVMWVNEIFDRENPDTYFLEV